MSNRAFPCSFVTGEEHDTLDCQSAFLCGYGEQRTVALRLCAVYIYWLIASKQATPKLKHRYGKEPGNSSTVWKSSGEWKMENFGLVNSRICDNAQILASSPEQGV
jgi:hypothetical protein